MNTVFCKHFGKEMKALDSAPLKGPIGDIILKNISEEAFNEWLELQIKIINEERLDLSDEKAQERLYRQMITFLKLEDLVG